MQTATNQAGETVVLVGNEWKPAEKIATNDKGEVAFLVGGQWLTKEAGPATISDRAKAFTSGVVRAGAGLAGLPVDTMQGAGNLIAAAGHAVASPFTDMGVYKPPFQGGPLSSQGIAEGMEKVGLSASNPRPDDAASRMLFTGGMIGATAGRRPVAPAVAGSTAAEVTGDPKWAGPASMAPAATSQAVGAARQAFADRMKPRAEMFEQAGTKPSVGQATEFNFIQGFENLLSKFPGGQGIFRKFSEKQQEQLGDRVSTGVSAETAGRAIEKGVSGFVTDSKNTWKKLDAELAAKMPKGSSIQPTQTVAALDELTASVAGAEKTTSSLVNPTIAKLKQDLTADIQANNGTLPFEAIRSLRTRVGGMLEDRLVSAVPQGELKKLYGALSKDMEAAANAAGAGKEFARQNKFYSARMQRIEGTLERILGNTAEETFLKFMPKNADQATTVRNVMRSLGPGERQIVTDAVVNRLGRATPGKQDAGGEVFSPETFLTNWNKLSPGAKQQLFPEASMRKNMDALAGTTENLRGGAKVFANPSGSAGAAAPYGMGYLMAVGNVATVGILAGGAAVGAKMLTSPKIVEWLAQAPKVDKSGGALHLARLGVIFNETKDEGLKQELSEFMKSVQAK